MANNSDRQPIFAGFPDNLKGESLEQMMRQLVDREQIRDLTAAYAHRVAHGLANADLFTDDGAYIHRRSPDEEAHEVRGREALDAHYIARPESRGVATPMIHNHLIEVEGDHARAICSIVRRQHIWRNSRCRLAEYRPRLGVDVRRRACGAASADVRWSGV